LRTLLQIVPKIPGGLDGVGDYALTIARGLREKFQCDTVFATFNADADQTTAGKVVPLDRLLDEAQFDRVLLHYVNYGFQKRGVPFRLLSILRELRERHRGKFVTIFHEMYASGPPWTSAFWLQPFQILLARSIARLSDACIVTSDHSRRELRRMTPDAEIALHPVPSTIGEPSFSAEQIANRDSHRWVIFGGTGLVERSLRSFRERLARIPEPIAPRSLFVLGGAENSATRSLLAKLEIESSYRPQISATEASEILKTCSFGFIDYFHRADVETAIILKSSAFVSLCAHGVVPVLPHHGTTVAVDGDHLPGPFFVGLDRAEMPAAEARGKIANEIYSWYQRHALSEHLVRKIAEKFALTERGGTDG
jgi:hypothetical protein